MLIYNTEKFQSICERKNKPVNILYISTNKFAYVY